MDSRLSYKFRDVGGAATIDGGGGGRTQLELVGKMPLLRETTITMSSSPLYTSHTTLVALASRRVPTRSGVWRRRRPSRDDLGASSSLNAFFPSIVMLFSQLD